MTNVIIGEFVGTILLVLLGDGVCANVTLNNSGFKAAGALFIALGWGSCSSTSSSSIQRHLSSIL